MVDFQLEFKDLKTESNNERRVEIEVAGRRFDWEIHEKIKLTVEGEVKLLLLEGENLVAEKVVDLKECTEINRFQIQDTALVIAVVELRDRCLYLDNLAKEIETNRSAIDGLWENRSVSKTTFYENEVKITMEPESVEETEPEILDLAEYGLEKLEEEGPDRLKAMMSFVAEKLAVMNENVEKLPGILKELEGKIEERRKTEVRCEEKNEELKGNWREKEKIIKEILVKKQEIERKLIVKQSETRDLQTDVSKLNSKLLEKKRELLNKQELKTKAQNEKKIVAILKEKIESKKSEKTNFEEQIEEISKLMEETLSRADQQKQRLMIEKSGLQEQLEGVRQDREEIQTENEQLQKKLADLEEAGLKIDNIKQKLKEALQLTQQEEQNYQQAREGATLVESNLEELISHYKSLLNTLLTNKKQSFSALPSLEASLDSTQIEITKTHEMNFLSSTEEIRSKQIICIKNDLVELIEDLTSYYASSSLGRDKLMGYCDRGTNFLNTEIPNIVVEAKNIEAHIDSIEDSEREIETLKSYISEVRDRNPPYLPIKDDPIDVALSEYLNTREDPIPIPFTREEEGVYLFGTKRVFVGIENGNLAIRGGGGYCSLDDFIEIYAPLELEQEENDLRTGNFGYESLTRFGKMQGMSPLRASRIIESSVESIAKGVSPKKRTSPRKKPQNNT